MPTASALRAAVTGLAADAIRPDGKIQLPSPVTGGERELTAAQAVNFASVWTHDYAPMTRSWLERTHGAAINFATLESCGRPLYARSAFVAPPQSLPSAYRRGSGPWWLITFCDDGGSPSVSIAVSAWATELTIQDGKLHFPMISGNEIVPIGVPLGHVGEYPMAPEIAVQMLAQKAGKRVAYVPELVTTLPSDGPPQLARWHLTLEGPTSVHTKSGTRTTNDAFVGPARVGGRDVATSVAALDQPTAIDMKWTPMPFVGERRAAYAVRAIKQVTKIQRRANAPVRVEPVSAWGNWKMKTTTSSKAVMTAAIVMSWSWLTALQCGDVPPTGPLSQQNCSISKDDDFPTDGSLSLNKPAKCPLHLPGFTHVPYAATADIGSDDFLFGFYTNEVISWNGFQNSASTNTVWGQSSDGTRWLVTISGDYPAASGGFDANNGGYDDVRNGFSNSRTGQWNYATTRIPYVFGSPSNTIVAPNGNPPPNTNYTVSGSTSDPLLTSPVTWSWYVNGSLAGTTADPQFTVHAGGPSTQQQVQLVGTDGNGHSVSGTTNIRATAGCGTKLNC
jgi:hypothetical protein